MLGRQADDASNIEKPPDRKNPKKKREEQAHTVSEGVGRIAIDAQTAFSCEERRPQGFVPAELVTASSHKNGKQFLKLRASSSPETPVRERNWTTAMGFSGSFPADPWKFASVSSTQAFGTNLHLQLDSEGNIVDVIARDNLQSEKLETNLRAFAKCPLYDADEPGIEITFGHVLHWTFEPGAHGVATEGGPELAGNFLTIAAVLCGTECTLEVLSRALTTDPSGVQ